MQPTRTTLELWALGRLEGPELAELEATLAADPDVREHALAVKEQVLDAGSDLPPLDLDFDELDEADEAGANVVPLFRRPALWGAGLAGALAVAAAAAVVVLLPDSDPGVVFRGGFDLEVYRVRLGEVAEQGALIDGQAGDRIQFRLTSDDAGWFQVFDLQDDGVLSTWLEPTPATRFEGVEGAVLLDDYPGSERAFFVFSEAPIDEEAVRDGLSSAWRTPLADLDALPSLGDAVQRSVLITRGEP